MDTDDIKRNAVLPCSEGTLTQWIISIVEEPWIHVGCSKMSTIKKQFFSQHGVFSLSQIPTPGA